MELGVPPLIAGKRLVAGVPYSYLHHCKSCFSVDDGKMSTDEATAYGRRQHRPSWITFD
jgi:hypothetical protein